MVRPAPMTTPTPTSSDTRARTMRRTFAGKAPSGVGETARQHGQGLSPKLAEHSAAQFFSASSLESIRR
jgi:hypothetical protein